MAEYVVEDVRLGGVLHRISRAQPGGGGEHARGKHLEEGVGREESADRRGLPSGARGEEGANSLQVGQPVFAQADQLEAVEVLAAGVLAKLRHAAAHQLGPDGVLLGGVGVPVLLDQIRGRDWKAALCKAQS